jgi:hypothetical protein
MKVIAGYSLYLLGSFLLIVACILNVLPQNYLGGFVIAGFIGGVCFPWLNAIRQGQSLIRKENSVLELEAKEPLEIPASIIGNPKREDEEKDRRREEPIVVRS